MSLPKYFVRYSTYKYDGTSNEVFETIDQVIEFLTKHATNSEFWFEVIYGEKIDFEPAEIIKSYKVKEKK